MNLSKIQKTFAELDIELEKAEAQLAEVQTLSKKLKDLAKTIHKLEQYYETDRLHEREFLHENHQDTFRSTGEDEIRNLLVAYREEQIALIKQLAHDL